MYKKSIYREMYDNSKSFSVKVTYKKPSKAKQSVEAIIRATMLSERGFGFRVLSHNAQFFSCAYLVPDKENGNLFLHVFTPTRNFYIEY